MCIINLYPFSKLQTDHAKISLELNTRLVLGWSH